MIGVLFAMLIPRGLCRSLSIFKSHTRIRNILRLDLLDNDRRECGVLAYSY